MRRLVLCLVLLSLAAILMSSPILGERTKRSLHHSKIKVKVVQRGPLGLRKHKYRYKGYGLGGGPWHNLGGYGHGGYGLGGYGHGGYGLGSYGHGGFGLGSYGHGGSSSFASSFSSPFGSFASAGTSLGR